MKNLEFELLKVDGYWETGLDKKPPIIGAITTPIPQAIKKF